MNSNRSSNQGQGKAKGKNRPKNSQKKSSKGDKALVSTRERGTAAAYAIERPIRIGLMNKKGHRVSWLTGYIWVGNGTIGATDSVYFVRTDQSQTLLPVIPMLGSDAVLGQTYVSDEEKHYARKVINRQWLHILSVNPSTANAMICVVAPIRGGGDVVHLTAQASTAAANTLANTIGQEGVVTVASYQSKTIDMTRFIAGGSGPRQNEFPIQGNAAQTSVVGQAIDGTGVVPSCFAVSGNSSTAGLRGTATHMVVVEQDMDLLDFLAGNTSADNWALAANETPKPDDTKYVEIVGTKTIPVRRAF